MIPMLQRNKFTVGDKMAVIREIEKGGKQSNVCRKFNLASSSVNTIWKNKEKIIKAYNEGNSSTRRIRKLNFENIDEAVFDWFKQERLVNATVTGPLVKAKGEFFAKQFGLEEFKSSEGWLEKFKRRHDISFGKGSSKRSYDDAVLEVPQQKGSTTAAQPQMKLGSPLVVTHDPLSVPSTNSVKSLPTTSSPSPLQVNSATTPTPPVPQPVQTTTIPEICLKWEAYNNNMRSMFPALLANERFVDVTLACEGQRIKCHKFMLSACSPYFDQLLGENPCRHPIVLLKDLQFWEVQAILDFIYKGEVRVRQDRLPMLLAAANCLQIKGLSEQATSSPSSCSNSNISEQNSSRHFSSVNESTTGELKRKALQDSSETKDSSSSDCDSDVESDDPSRLIVVGSNDEADSTSTSSGIPMTNGTLIKKIRLEKNRSPEKTENKNGENKDDNPSPEKKRKSCPSNPPNLIKIERSQYPIIPKSEDLSYENDDGSMSPSYYPAFPEALVDTVLTEEDSSQ